MCVSLFSLSEERGQPVCATTLPRWGRRRARTPPPAQRLVLGTHFAPIRRCFQVRHPARFIRTVPGMAAVPADGDLLQQLNSGPAQTFQHPAEG